MRAGLEQRIAEVAEDAVLDEVRASPLIQAVLPTLAAAWIVDATDATARFLLHVGTGTAFWLALADRIEREPTSPWRAAGLAAFVCPDAAGDPLVNARIGAILVAEGRWEALIAILAIADPHHLLADVLASYLAGPEVRRDPAILGVAALARTDLTAIRRLTDDLKRHELLAAARVAAGAALAGEE